MESSKFNFTYWSIYGDNEQNFLSEVLESGFWAGSSAKYSGKGRAAT